MSFRLIFLILPYIMRNRYHQLQLFFLCLTAFVFPLYIKLTSFTLILLFFSSFILKDNRKAYLSLLKNPLYYLFISPILVAIAGLINADSFSQGWGLVTVLSSLVLFPFVFISFGQNPLQNKYQYINSFFILGITTAFLLCLGLAYLNFAHYHNKDYFFYARLSSYIMSPNHLSFYVLWAILLIVTDLTGLVSNLILYNSKISKVLALLILMCFLFLLASKAAFLIFCVLVAAFILYLIINRVIPVWQSVIIIAVVSMLGFYLYQTTNIKGRIQFAYKVLESDKVNQSASQESTALRLSAFEASKNIIKENLFSGVGTGDVQKSMLSWYNQHGKSGAYIHQTNPHNQYLFSFIMNGITGLLALLAMFGAMFYKSVKEKNITFFFWSVFMFLMFFTDDIMTIQIGVVFFAFYSSSFLFRQKPINTYPDYQHDPEP